MQRGYIEILVTYKFSMYPLSSYLSIALDMETSTANKFSQK